MTAQSNPYPYAHIVGQDRAKYLLAAVARVRANVLLIAPPGMGKTMMARAYLGQFGRRVLELNGRKATPEALKASRGLTLIDEAHKMRDPESLYPPLDRRGRRGALSSRRVCVFALCTTDEGELPPALVSRLVPVALEPYTVSHLAAIAGLDGCHPAFPAESLLRIAQFSLGSPRRAKLLASLLLSGYPTGLPPHAIGPALARLGYQSGLTSRQVNMLCALATGRKGMATLCGMFGYGRRTERSIEADLIRAGLVEITSRGRAITPSGLEMLDRIDRTVR